MTTIRPNPFPQTPPQAGPSADAAKLAAQKAFFAMVSGGGQAQPAAAASVAQPAVAAAPAPVIRSASAAPDPAPKIPRPGSLFDIRV